MNQKEKASDNQTKISDILESVIRSVDEGIVVADRTGKFLVFNDAAEKILGLGPIDTEPEEWSQTYGVFYPDSSTVFPASELPLVRAMRGDKVENVELFIRNSKIPNGLLVSVSANPLRDDKGQLTGGVVVFRNITIQKRIEESIRTSQKMEALGKLVAGISHEFNNTLSGVIGNAELILDDMDNHNPLKADVESIHTAATRASQLSNQLLAFSGKQVLQPKIININDIIPDLLGMLKSVLGEKVRVHTILRQDLFSCKMDPGQVGQIILNLILNARDAMPDGGELSLDTSNYIMNEDETEGYTDLKSGRYCCISISDTGVGMDVETVKHIFEPFYTTKGMDKAAGMGLSAVYGIVKQSGGKIRVESEPGKGSKFKIYLPSFNQVGESSTEKKILSPEKIEEGSKTILVVEDERLVRNLIERILYKYGYMPLVASSAKEAIAISDQYKQDIQLMITDVVMPHTDGYALAKTITQKRPGIKTLLISGYEQEVSSLSDKSGNQMHFLPKPFGVKVIVSKIQEVLRT